MDVDELRDQVKGLEYQLESYIRASLDGFRQDTGFSVQSIDVVLEKVHVNSGEDYYILLGVKCEIDLEFSGSPYPTP